MQVELGLVAQALLPPGHGKKNTDDRDAEENHSPANPGCGAHVGKHLPLIDLGQ